MQIELRDALSVLALIVGAVAAYFGGRVETARMRGDVKGELAQLRGEMSTTLQSVKDSAEAALAKARGAHDRLDDLDKRQRSAERDLARLEERIGPRRIERVPESEPAGGV